MCVLTAKVDNILMSMENAWIGVSGPESHMSRFFTPRRRKADMRSLSLSLGRVWTAAWKGKKKMFNGDEKINGNQIVVRGLDYD